MIALHRRIVGFALLLATILAASPRVSHASPPWYTETIQGGGFVGDYIRLAVDTEGIPHVVYFDYGNFFVIYATRVDGAWTTEVIAAEVFAATDMDIAVDAQGTPHVSYHAYTGIGIDELRYAVRTGPGSWSVEDVDPTNDDVGKYNSIAIDSQGRPCIAYYNETLADLKYAVKTGGWSIEIADGTWGLYADLALDSSDRPHIVYFSPPPTELLYITKIGSSWIVETVGTTGADYNGIALDPAGNPVLLSRSGGYLNVYTRETGSFVNIGAFATTADIDGALAIDNQGTVHVFYQDVNAGANDLWYLEVRDSVPSVSPAALGGSTVDLGDKCDIALDPYGNPLGVYYDATNGDALFIDSGVRLSSALSGVTWPVGSERSVSWKGAGTVDIYLSSDGGASYEVLAVGLNSGGGGGTYNFTVPHQPSRFCKIKLMRTSPFAASLSDSLFTIEASVALLNFVVTLPDGGGASMSWSTNPGPEDLAGYRVERRRDEGAWSTLVALTDKTSYHDPDGQGGDEYRLFAVNGLGEELLLGAGNPGRAPAITALGVYPNPFGAGELTVDFATSGGLGGGAGPTTVAVYDVAGRLVRMLADRPYPAGMQRVTWDGRDARGETVSSGVYFVRSVTGAGAHTRKVLVVR